MSRLDPSRSSTAIVTGGASGIGRATGLRLARSGIGVLVADIDSDAADRVVAEIVAAGGRAEACVADVSEETAVRAMVERCVATLGAPTIVCNVAADLGETFLRDTDLMTMDVDVWDRAMAVNLRGVMLTTKHCLPHLVVGGGSIVNFSSVAATLGDTQRFAYGASKAAIVALTKYTATAYGDRGVRCNAVAPGLVMTDVAAQRLSERALQVARAGRLLEAPCTPDDVARVVCFLASAEACAMTGSVVVVDSGTTAHTSGYGFEKGLLPPRS